MVDGGQVRIGDKKKKNRTERTKQRYLLNYCNARVGIHKEMGEALVYIPNH